MKSRERYSREQFNASRGLVCLRPILYDGKQYKVGQTFPVRLRDKKAVTRARQLYQMRKLEHKDKYKALQAAKKEDELENNEVSDDMDI